MIDTLLLTKSGTESIQRLRVTVRGAVQGVGFRPFVYRLSTEMQLPGWVNNSSQGVFIEVEGPKEKLQEFLQRLSSEKPPRSYIQSLEPLYLEPEGFTTFEIRPSVEGGGKSALILPDIATCPDCLSEIFDPSNRRYHYPFTNCTNCGPRYTIIEAIPYDRPNTTMKGFPMCERCRAEYNNPLDRRFHAQPNACPDCGPHIELWSSKGRVLDSGNDALLCAAEAIRNGAIVAVKGLGGFHLVVDARDEAAVIRLRQHKGREEKPFALMCPSIEQVRTYCEVSGEEARLLSSPEAPIVLLSRHPGAWKIASSIAPGNPYLGVMLPYTPLHHILLSELSFPIVATSGNLSDEPICTDEQEALRRLGGIADLFLVHNRPIARHSDDSVVRILGGREMVLRRARGYAPLPVRLMEPVPEPVLAVGGHLKNSVALAIGHAVFISQHIGDLETVEATGAFECVIADLQRLYDAAPAAVSCDAHPDYLSTKYADETGLPLYTVQHHAAHVFACMAENELDGPVLGVSWDGTGYGTDGTVWGGEFLHVTGKKWQREAHLRLFRLPGGDKAVKEPRRSAFGLLQEVFGDGVFAMADLAPLQACNIQELSVWQTMIHKGINAPLTSSVGRLFDAVASILGIRQRTAFEGQAAMELEFAAQSVQTEERYNFEIVAPYEDSSTPVLLLDWEPMLREIIYEARMGEHVGKIAAKFHNTLVEMIISMAQLVGEPQVVLSGGCFQNMYLAQRAILRLKEEGFRPYWHQRVPPNDGGIALGQVLGSRYTERI